MLTELLCASTLISLAVIASYVVPPVYTEYQIATAIVFFGQPVGLYALGLVAAIVLGVIGYICCKCCACCAKKKDDDDDDDDDSGDEHDAA